MKTSTPDSTKRDTKIPTPPRDGRISSDGKWKSFPKVPNLMQYVATGVYFARLKVDGKPIRRSLDTDVFTTAKLRLPDFVKKEQRKKRIAGAPVSFGEARQLYEQDTDADHVLSASSKRYRGYCLRALDKSWPHLNEQRLNRITAADCKEWANRLADTLDAQYFNNVLGTFRAILKLASIRGEDDPSADIKRLGIKPKVLELPSQEKFEELLQHIDGSGAGQAHHCADLFRFLAYSGCRISEARLVKWTDVNFDKGVMTVQNAKTRKANSGKPTREVPMIPDMLTLLERLKQSNPVATDRVCVLGECQKSLTRACTLAGVRRITHHDLRHLFATRCIESMVDIPTVSRWLGHSDGGALAMKVYGHLRDQHSVEMAKKVTFTKASKASNVIPMLAKEAAL